MNAPPMRYLLLAVLAGALWGAIGLALAGRTLGAPTWGGVLAAPVIGLVVALAFRGFRDRPPGARIALSLVSLYLATGLFALAVGVADAARPIQGRIPGAVVIQALMGVWWGITFTGFLPLLWPLAYLTHSLLGRADDRRPGGGRPARPGTAGPATALRAPAHTLVVPPCERIVEPPRSNASLARGITIGMFTLAAALVLLSLLRKFRGPLGELAVLLAVLGFLFFGGRSAWRWWKGQPATIASTGVLGALGVASAGWVLVAFVHALSKVSSENYGMIVVWPLVFVAGSALILGGALAAAVSAASIVTALTKRPAHGALVALGGAAAVVLNLLHVVALTRRLFTG